MSEPILDARTFWELLDRRASATPDGVALLDAADRSMTWGELRDRAEHVANKGPCWIVGIVFWDDAVVGFMDCCPYVPCASQQRFLHHQVACQPGSRGNNDDVCLALLHCDECVSVCRSLVGLACHSSFVQNGNDLVAVVNRIASAVVLLNLGTFTINLT